VGGLSLELTNEDTGAVLCRNEATYGTDEKKTPHNELGYVVAIPPCLWSHHDPNRPKPPRLYPWTRIRITSRYNSTLGHWGVMAMWQGRGIFVNGVGDEVQSPQKLDVMMSEDEEIPLYA